MVTEKDYATLREFSKLTAYDRSLTFFRIIGMDRTAMPLWVESLTEKYKKFNVTINSQELLREIEAVA